MTVSLTVNGVSFDYPQTGEDGWGTNATNWASAVTTGMLQKAGGTFTLTAEVDFGGTFGLKVQYLKSKGTNIAAAGVVRLANAETISWRNNANSADLALTASAADNLTFGGTKVILSGAIVNADIDASAAIARSKLASGTADHVLINNGSGVMSSEATLAKSRGGAGADMSSVTFPGSGVLVTEAGTQTLTNKTITGSVAASFSNSGTVTLPTGTVTLATLAGSETLTNKNLANSNNTLSGATATSFTNGGTITLPSGTLTLATLTGTEALTNKDIDGGTAANTRRITLPKDSAANIAALTRKQGTLVYDTTNNVVKYDDGSSLNTLSTSALYNPGSTSGLVDGTNGLKGFTDGSSGASGYLGEKMSATAGSGTHGTTTVADTWTDASSMGTITLTAGTWLIGYNVSLSLRSNSGTNDIFGSVAIYETTNQISETVCGVTAGQVQNTHRFAMPCSRTTVVTNNSSKTYKLQTRCSVATATADVFIEGTDSLSSSLTNPDNHSVLWAIRIR